MSEHKCDDWGGVCESNPDHCMIGCRENTDDLEAKLREAEERIEVLKIAGDAMINMNKITETLRQEAEAKVAAAVEALTRIAGQGDADFDYNDMVECAEVALASLGQVPERVRAEREVSKQAFLLADKLTETTNFNEDLFRPLREALDRLGKVEP